MKSLTLTTALTLATLTHSLPAPLTPRASGSTYTSGATANDITSGVCAPLTFIFARGSTETGNIGTVVGPGLCQNLIKDLGATGVACQGVEYAASIQGNINMGADGGPAMAKLAKLALSQCPETKLALAGYSQGAMVVHNAVEKQGLSVEDVGAVVLFGDPMLGQSVGSVPASKLKEYCATGDGVCETHSFAITAAHLSYGSDTAEAAKWIVSTAGASSSSSSSNASRSSNETATSTTSSGSSSASDAAASSTSETASTSGSSGLGSFGGLSGLGSGSLPTGLGSLGSGSGSGSSGLGSLPTGLGSLGGSSGSSGLGSLGSLSSLGGSGASLPTGLSSLGGSSGTGSSGLGSLGSGSSGLGSLGGLGSSSGSSGASGLSGLGGLGGLGGVQN